MPFGLLYYCFLVFHRHCHYLLVKVLYILQQTIFLLFLYLNFLKNILIFFQPIFSLPPFFKINEKLRITSLIFIKNSSTYKSTTADFLFDCLVLLVFDLFYYFILTCSFLNVIPFCIFVLKYLTYTHQFFYYIYHKSFLHLNCRLLSHIFFLHLIGVQ
mgnify:CR=1 FL=1